MLAAAAGMTYTWDRSPCEGRSTQCATAAVSFRTGLTAQIECDPVTDTTRQRSSTTSGGPPPSAGKRPHLVCEISRFLDRAEALKTTAASGGE